jgi:peptidoglycan/LPS O-acetylase OafA/YrhL
LALGAVRARVAVIAWLLAAPVVRLALLKVFPHDFGRYENWTPLRVDSIAAGCLLALIAHHPTFLRLARPRRPVALALIAAAALGLVVNFLIATRISMYGVAVENSIRAGFIVVIIWLSINQAGTLWGKLLDSRPLVTIGVLSYSLYLWQQLFLAPHATEWVRTLPWAVFAAIACAVASYVLVERPFLRLKDKFGR